MKNIILNKDNVYSLHNTDNFKTELHITVNEITTKYSNLVIEYLKFITENIKIKNKSFSNFIITRGLDTITSVFLILLYYTKNIDVTYFHCQKSFYFYLEFVDQISEDDKMFLQLSSRDAATYVYKKTIYEINNEFKKNIGKISDETRSKLDLVHLYISMFKTFTYKIIQNGELSKDNNFIILLKKIADTFNIEKIDIEYVSMLDSIMDILYHYTSDVEYFFYIIQILIKKINKNPDVIQKCNTHKFNDNLVIHLKESPEQFMKWMIG